MNVWRSMSDSGWVLNVVESGFRLPWDPNKAPLLRSPPAFRPPSSEEAVAALEAEVSSLLAKEPIEPVHSPPSPGFYGRIFVVPKASGAWRPVLDLSALNQYLRRIPFRMETAQSVREAIRPGDWAASLDLTDAYFHILIHRRDRKWLRFVWNGRIYQFRALPFGLSLSPWVFTRVTRELALQVRSRGIRLCMYLDDWLILAQSATLCDSQTAQVRALAASLGFVINLEKSELTPSQKFQFLGMVFDTRLMTVRPTPARLDHLSTLLATLSSRVSASARQLVSLLGQMESLSSLLPLGRLHKRRFQREFALRWNQDGQAWNSSVPLGPWFQETTHQWSVHSWLESAVPIVALPHDLELFTDASLSGWGAHMGRFHASGRWSSSLTVHISIGSNSKQ